MEAKVNLTGVRLMGRLDGDCDLLAALVEKCRENNISLGEVRGVEALSKARLACFDQPSRKYEFMEHVHDLNVASMTGNISLLGSKPIVHVHMVLVDDEGRVFGGQLAKGCLAYAVEYIIVEYTSQTAFTRDYDEATGLMLWQSGA